MKKTGMLLLVVAGAALLLGAAPAQNRDILDLKGQVEVLKSRMITLQDSLNTSAVKDAETQKLIEQLMSEIQQLPGKVQSGNQTSIQGLAPALDAIRANNDKNAAELRTELLAQMKSLRESIDKLSQALNDTTKSELAILEGKIDKLAKEFRDSKNVAAPQQETPQKVMREADVDFLTRNYDLAIGGYRDFLEKFPRHALAVEAQYKIGDSYSRMGKFDQAIVAFDLVVQNYTDPDKTRSALYQKALAQASLNDKPGAIITLNRIVKDYPKTPEADLATQKLKELQPTPAPAARRGAGAR